MEVTVKQVTFVNGAALVAGEPVGDITKVVVAAVEDPGNAFPLAMAVAAGMAPVVEVPDDAIVEVLEKPQGL